MVLKQLTGGSAELRAMVFNIMRFATHDGPGIRTTVFFKGCPLSCWWCHNPESQGFQPDLLYFDERCRHCGECVAACPQHAIRQTGEPVKSSQKDDNKRSSVPLDVCRGCGRCAEVCQAEARQLAGKRMGLHEIVAEIEKDLIFFEESGGGVTLSGGEPLAQPEIAAAILRACCDRGIHTVLETCGYARPNTFRSVALLADLVLFDVKLMTAALHREYTGLSNIGILQNLEELFARGRPVTVRIPLVPGINDTAEEVDGFARYLGRFRGCRVELLPYHRIGAAKYARMGRTYRLKDTPEPAAADLARIGDRLTRAGLNVTLGG
ncbi:MAG: glycyl-radical enzyme activating protein [Acidobacteriia bacterium]|nr:glycyl-radical enzyme activating protein [Terriglobia bacterium]